MQWQEEYQEAKGVVKECDGKLPSDVTPKLYQVIQESFPFVLGIHASCKSIY